MRASSLVTMLVLAAALPSYACRENNGPTGCDGVTIEGLKELEIVETSVIGDARAQNRAAGPMSFRAAAEASGNGARFARSLFDAYGEVAKERADALAARVLVPWIARSGGALDLATSPLRLIGIANRGDLGDDPDALSPAGEGRLVFAVTDGPADDPASAELPMTVIFEYALLGDRGTWARGFHELSKYEAFSDGYRSELADLVTQFAGPGARLAQIRINDGAFGAGQLYAELALDERGALHARGLRNTPDPRLDPAMLVGIARDSAGDLEAGRFVLPLPLRAATIERAHTWALPDVPEPTRKAFAQGTCNGCHGAEQPNEAGFHVAPGASGTARLSKFLLDPGRPGDDEALHRAERASAILCR